MNRLRLRGSALVLAAGLMLSGLPCLAEGLPEPPSTLTLDQAIARALAHNPQILEAEAQVHAAEAGSRTAKLSPLRSASANFAFNTPFMPNTGGYMPGSGAYLTLNLGDILSTPFTMQAADAQLDGARQALRQTQLQVVSATTEAYSAWITQQKMLALKKDAIQASQSDSMVIQRLFGRGTATISDVMKARLGVSQSQAELVEAEGQYNKTWAALVAQMGDTSFLDHRRATRNDRRMAKR